MLEHADIEVSRRHFDPRNLAILGGAALAPKTSMRSNSGSRASVPDLEGAPERPEHAPESQRMTFDVGAIASIAGLHDTGGNVPLSRCVPERTACSLPEKISDDEVRVLLRIDGHTTLGEMAEELEMPLAEVVAIFLGVLGQGLAEVPWQGAPLSGVVPKSDSKND